LILDFKIEVGAKTPLKKYLDVMLSLSKHDSRRGLESCFKKLSMTTIFLKKAEKFLRHC
jgi:hypothetical protein